MIYSHGEKNRIFECIYEMLIIIIHAAYKSKNSTLTMLNMKISCFEYSVDPDQLASQKTADLDPHCFPVCL